MLTSMKSQEVQVLTSKSQPKNVSTDTFSISYVHGWKFSCFFQLMIISDARKNVINKSRNFDT